MRVTVMLSANMWRSLCSATRCTVRLMMVEVARAESAYDLRAQVGWMRLVRCGWLDVVG